MTNFTDMNITCRDCGTSFVWTASEQEFYQSRGFENQPVRCRDCRNRRKAERGVGSSASVAMSTSTATVRRQREMFPAVCDECGRETQVPFQPTSGKPVYCSECFERRRSY